MPRLKLFIRQPLTRTQPAARDQVQEILDLLVEAGRDLGLTLESATGFSAQDCESFQGEFERASGQAFSPRAFRAWRLRQMDAAQGLIQIRTDLSESGAFELGYWYARHPRRPALLLQSTRAAAATTMMQQLERDAAVDLVSFSSPAEIVPSLRSFLLRAAPAAPARLRVLGEDETQTATGEDKGH